MTKPNQEIIPVKPSWFAQMSFIWRAVYHDGSGKLTEDKFLMQFNEDGTENKYADIDRWKLGRFDLINRVGKVVYSVYLHTDQILIYRRRNFIILGGRKSMIFLIGWRQSIQTPNGPKVITIINYLYEDGTIALDNHRNNLELLPEEN